MEKIQNIIKKVFPAHRETPIYEDIQQILEEPNNGDDKITSLKCIFGVDIPVILLSFLMDQIYFYTETQKEITYFQQQRIHSLEKTNMSKRKKSRKIRRIRIETTNLIRQQVLQKEIYQKASRLFIESKNKANYADEIMVNQFNNFVYRIQEVFPDKNKCSALLYQNKSFCQHQKNFEDMAHYFLQQMVLEYTCLVGIVRYKSDLLKNMPTPSSRRYHNVSNAYRTLLYTYVLLYGHDKYNMEKIYERMKDEGVMDFYVSAYDIKEHGLVIKEKERINHMHLIGVLQDIFPRREEPIYKTISSILKQQRSYYDQAMALYNLFGVNNPLLLELFFYKQIMFIDRLINTMSPLAVNNKSDPMRNTCSTLELLQYQRNIYDKAELAIDMQTHMRLGIRTAIQFDKFIAFARVTLFEFQAASRKENDCKKSLTKRSSSFYETFSYWLEPMLWDCSALCLFLEEKGYKLQKNIEIDNDALRCIEEMKQVQKTLTLLQEKMYGNI